MSNNIIKGIIVGFFFICLILFFCAMLIRLYIKKIRTYNELLLRKDLDFQKTLNTTIIEAQEHLLQNISQDLHDDAGQQLTYINFQLENLKLDSSELKAKLEPVSKSVTSLSKSVRAISHSLNSQMVSQQDLVKLIISELKRLKKNGRIAFHCHIEDTPKSAFDTNTKIVIYRIFQEILNNAIKHSGARNIATTITTVPAFKLIVSDDGKGFEYDEAQKKLGMGLQNLKSRAQIINFDIRINSTVNQGTTITLTENSQ